MLKLFYSPFHMFIHKSLVVIHESGIQDQVECVPTFPFNNTDGKDVKGQYPMSEINPLGKVPTLALEDGKVLYGSQAVVEYLDSLTTIGRRLFPDDGPKRWDALRRLALGDTVFEVGGQMGIEGRIPPAKERPGLYEWIQPKIEMSFDLMEKEAKTYKGFDIGHVALLQAISYTAALCQARSDEPNYPNYDWRKGHHKLAAWFDETVTRTSVRAHYNKPYEGDMSPEFHQKKIREVIETQKANGMRS